MVKLSGSGADAFIRQPDPSIRAVLIYGPDEGQARDRLSRLTRTVCPDPNDPFRIADIPPSALKDDPARLADECAALSFGGGRRVVRVAAITDAQGAPVLGFLANPRGDALLIVSAGALTPRSKLRSGFETAKAGAAIACYPLEGAQMASALRNTCQEAGLRVDSDALELLGSLLADDSACLKAEVEKLRLFLGVEQRAITAEDVLACCGDQSEHTAFELAYAVGDGNHRAVQGISGRLFAAGDSPIAILRGIARHFDRLLQACGAIDAGIPPDQAIKTLKPPVFFKETAAFHRQIGIWSSAALLSALSRLVEVERQCKTTGMPAVIVAQRGLMEIASLANRTRSGRA